MYGFSCNKMCGNSKVNDETSDNSEASNNRVDGEGPEECDLGDYNVDM